jgi:phosphoglucosamine mutase
MARQLFGTDGIRGVAGEYPLDARTVHAFGAALGDWAEGTKMGAEVVIGMDTRESGPWLAEQVAGGLARHGVNVRFAGLITTPGVAYLTRTQDFIAGVMISASHNPFQDNGLKAFDHSGYKLPDEQEHKIEAEMFRLLNDGMEPAGSSLVIDEGLDRTYLDFLASTFPQRIDGLRIVVDCANGAASRLGPQLFEQLGAHVYSMGALPDGRNINLNCGALHTGGLREQVLAQKADIGMAFDGDADRAMFISSSGKLIDGDAVLLLAGRALKSEGRLPGDTVVATVMSNLGLERALTASGIAMLRTPVGDKYVLEEMMRRDASLGGEQSGHVIFREYATTGDGLLTALRVLETLNKSGRSLDELTADLEVYPQVLVNVRVKNRRPLEELETVKLKIREVESDFGDAGRVLVRFSGTEPLARVMVEGPELARVEAGAKSIADAIRAELGA